MKLKLNFMLSPVSFLSRITVSILFINLFAVILVFQSLYQIRLQYEERAGITTENLALVLAYELSSEMEKSDLALVVVTDEYARQGSNGGIDRKALKAYIERAYSRLPYLDALQVTNAEGTIVFGKDILPGAEVSVADRDYFIKLRNHPNAGLAISTPQPRRINSEIVFSRRLNLPNGDFAGIVSSATTAKHLSELLSRIDVGKKGFVALGDEQLSAFVRYPEADSADMAIGTKMVPGEVLELIHSGQTAGTFNVRSPLDNSAITSAYRKVPDYPLYIVVAISMDEYLLEWRNQAAKVSLLAALFLVISMTLLWLVNRSWKREIAFVKNLTHQAHTDFLTNLSNRRYFMELAESELARTVRYGGSLSLLMLDIDRFKRINDTYGHKVGDRVLQSLAELFRKSLREVDIVGRLGGEEFAVLLPETDEAHALEVAERLRQSIADSELSLVMDRPLRFTVSIGLTTFKNGDANLDTLLGQADEALYEAKRSGRNTVCSRGIPFGK